MRLPNAEQAVVEHAKIADYLLNEQHEDGRSKAQFFISFGFRPESPELLIAALHDLVQQCDVSSLRPSLHGTKYIVIGKLRTPDGREPVVKTVWMIDHGNDVPRLITALPGNRSNP